MRLADLARDKRLVRRVAEGMFGEPDKECLERDEGRQRVEYESLEGLVAHKVVCVLSACHRKGEDEPSQGDAGPLKLPSITFRNVSRTGVDRFGVCDPDGLTGCGIDGEKRGLDLAFEGTQSVGRKHGFAECVDLLSSCLLDALEAANGKDGLAQRVGLPGCVLNAFEAASAEHRFAECVDLLSSRLLDALEAASGKDGLAERVGLPGCVLNAFEAASAEHRFAECVDLLSSRLLDALEAASGKDGLAERVGLPGCVLNAFEAASAEHRFAECGDLPGCVLDAFEAACGEHGAPNLLGLPLSIALHALHDLQILGGEHVPRIGIGTE